MKLLLAMTIILILTTLGCASRSDGEICDLVKCCFDKKSGMTIIFEPQPETKEPQVVVNH